MPPSDEPHPAAKAWNAPEYQQSHSYIWHYGASLVEMLNPQPGERILDLGCGTGHLTAEIARSGAEVVGIDNSPDMVRIAKENFPDIPFQLADARDFHFSEGFDAVFSNAALHWIKEAEKVLDSITGCLNSGGRITAEMGGRGNIESVVSALRQALASCLGHSRSEVDPWYFPTIGQYSALLEQRGFEMSFANHFSRPTPLKDGEEGLRDWIRMFCSEFVAGLEPEIEERVLTEVEDELRPVLFDGVRWVVDYRRLRFQAHKISPPHLAHIEG